MGGFQIKFQTRLSKANNQITMANIEKFHRPDLNLPKFPLINFWIDVAYQNVNSFDELVDFTYRCIDQADESENPVRKQAYFRVGAYLYSLITGISLESKAIELSIMNQ